VGELHNQEKAAMRALVTGATGFVGRKLLARLQDPVVLSRDAQRARQNLQAFHPTVFPWNPADQAAPAQAFEGVDVVFHLAGESVADGRWTAAKKQRLQDSRILGTRNLIATIAELDQPPQVLISASAVGYYGDRGDQKLVESDAPGEGFLADLSVAWEMEAQKAAASSVRVVNPRIGIVLSPDGGALARLLPIFRKGMGSPLGDGHQYMAWIHIDDLLDLMLLAAEQESISGPLNATAPHPVTNRDFTKTLAAVLHRPLLLPPVPKLALRLSMGEFADSLFHSQRVLPNVAEQAGFPFRYPQLDVALQQLLTKS
jgi:uncharacterized protein